MSYYLLVVPRLIIKPHSQVEVEVESIDRVGNFIGWMFVENENLSVKLVEVSVHRKFHYGCKYGIQGS